MITAKDLPKIKKMLSGLQNKNVWRPVLKQSFLDSLLNLHIFLSHTKPAEHKWSHCQSKAPISRDPIFTVQDPQDQLIASQEAKVRQEHRPPDRDGPIPGSGGRETELFRRRKGCQ